MMYACHSAYWLQMCHCRHCVMSMNLFVSSQPMDLKTNGPQQGTLVTKPYCLLITFQVTLTRMRFTVTSCVHFIHILMVCCCRFLARPFPKPLTEEEVWIDRKVPNTSVLHAEARNCEGDMSSCDYFGLCVPYRHGKLA
jgi:hypothetical protein